MMGSVNGNEYEAASLNEPLAFPSQPGVVQPGFYVPLVRSLMEPGFAGEVGGSFVFTSGAPGEGVTYVTNAVARELAAVSGKRVLIAATSSIGNFEPAASHELNDPVMREGNGVFRLRPPATANRASRNKRFQLLAQLEELFPFVLVDGPALSTSAEALEFGARSRGVVLVAAAGKVRKNRLQLTKRMIDISGVPLLGCALNRRTYPIPEFLYKRL